MSSITVDDVWQLSSADCPLSCYVTGA